MKRTTSHSLALAISTLGASSWAAQHDQKDEPRPAGATAPAASPSAPGTTTPGMARMADQMKAMQEMHDKMMAAKTPDERNALMAGHMKTMQEGMGMMRGMGGMRDPNGPPINMTERQTAYFSDRRRSEQSDRRRRFRLIEDDHGGARVMR